MPMANMQLESKIVLQLIEEAMEKILLVDKVAYLEAEATAKEVLLKESNPLQFLRFEGLNTLAAAKRLAMYWKWRKFLFGARAFRPLRDFSGSGALSSDDIESLSCGSIAILPKDSEGNSILFFDRTRLPKPYAEYGLITILRFFFFFVSVACEDEQDNSENPGLVFLNLLQPDLRTFKGQVLRNMAACVKDGFPIKFKSAHLLSISQDPNTQSLMNHILPHRLDQWSTLAEETTIECHTGRCKEELCNILLKFGFKQNGLPPVLGGSWSSSNVTDWINGQKQTQTSQRENVLLGRTSTNDDSNEKRHSDLLSEKLKQIAEFTKQSQRLDETSADSRSPTASIQNQRISDTIQKERNTSSVTEFQGSLNQKTTVAAPSPVANYDSLLGSAPKNSITEMRERLFGSRASLPMKQTGSGALGKEDIATLDTGFLVTLPSKSEDDLLLCYDPAKAKDCSFTSQRRCLFYMLYRKASELSSLGNFSILQLVSNGSIDYFAKEKTFVDVHSCFPLCFVALHAILDPTSPVLLATDPERIRAMLRELWGIGGNKTFLHRCATFQDIRDSLFLHGFGKENLPSSIGGLCTEKIFLEWQKDVVRRELSQQSPLEMANPGLPAKRSIESMDNSSNSKKRLNTSTVSTTFGKDPTMGENYSAVAFPQGLKPGGTAGIQERSLGQSLVPSKAGISNSPQGTPGIKIGGEHPGTTKQSPLQHQVDDQSRKGFGLGSLAVGNSSPGPTTQIKLDAQQQANLSFQSSANNADNHNKAVDRLVLDFLEKRQSIQSEPVRQQQQQQTSNSFLPPTLDEHQNGNLLHRLVLSQLLAGNSLVRYQNEAGTHRQVAEALNPAPWGDGSNNDLRHRLNIAMRQGSSAMASATGPTNQAAEHCDLSDKKPAARW